MTHGLSVCLAFSLYITVIIARECTMTLKKKCAFAYPNRRIDTCCQRNPEVFQLLKTSVFYVFPIHFNSQINIEIMFVPVRLQRITQNYVFSNATIIQSYSHSSLHSKRTVPTPLIVFFRFTTAYELQPCTFINSNSNQIVVGNLWRGGEFPVPFVTVFPFLFRR